MKRLRLGLLVLVLLAALARLLFRHVVALLGAVAALLLVAAAFAALTALAAFATLLLAFALRSRALAAVAPARVVRAARDEGVGRSFEDEAIAPAVTAARWDARYVPARATSGHASEESP